MRRSTLAKREKRLVRASRRQKLCDRAARMIDEYVMTPEEAKDKYGRKTRAGGALAAMIGMMATTTRAYAAQSGNEFQIVDSAIDFLLNLLMGVGVCFIAFGVISLAISFQSHDDSQKSKAVMAIVGGAIAVSVRSVLNALGVTAHLG